MTRHITKMLLAASALTVLAVAPAAYAAPAVDTKSHAIKKTAKTSPKTVKVAERGTRNRANRTRTTRQSGATRPNVTRSNPPRSNTGRSNGARSDRGVNTRRRSTTGNARVNRTAARTVRNRAVSRNNIRSVFGGVNNNRGYRTNYRSSLGISFHLGSPGYSSYRWAPTAYSLYSPSYGSYGYYQRSTACRRVNVEGWYRGYRELISVKQCSNPWNGSYIVQGSERLVGYY